MIILITITIFYTQIKYPTQSKTIPLLIKKDQLLNTNSTINITYQKTNIIINSINNIIITTITFFPLYSINSLIFLITYLFILNINIPNITNPTKNNPSYLQNLKKNILKIKNSLLLIITLINNIINFKLKLLYT